MVAGISVPLIDDIQKNGIMPTICDPDNHLIQRKTLLFWVNIFVWSKYIELIDTFLLIVKNPSRPVPFLHYYHHATVLLFTWYAIVFEFTVGVWFGMINGFVHTIMYFYYFLTELGYRPSWAVVITVIQISQMVIGIALNYIWASKYFSGAGCSCKAPETILGSAVVMYGSYLFLFLQFFVKRYFGKYLGGSSKQKTN
jgi:elongation of very long chain fatty acids protein 6